MGVRRICWQTGVTRVILRLATSVNFSHSDTVDTLGKYRKQALKLAEIADLGPKEGFAATIPGFRGLIAVGGTKKEAMIELESTLQDWVDLALKRGIGLPKIATKKAELIPA